MAPLLLPLTFLLGLGSGLIGGLFFAFSAFIMTALGRLSHRIKSQRKMQ